MGFVSFYIYIKWPNCPNYVSIMAQLAHYWPNYIFFLDFAPGDAKNPGGLLVHPGY